jgi:ABC-2 type transport system permease protein
MSAPRSDFIAPVGGLITPQREAQVFWQLRVRTTSANIRRMFTTARLRMALVAGLSIFFWVGLYLLFYRGFEFVSNLSTDIVPPLYNAFFLALMVMLTFSSGIILHSSLFCSPETAFLLTTPARTERIFAQKLQEAVWFSSWGFILLGSPTLVAYGVSTGAPWYYYALILPFVIAFVHIPAAIGGILCLVIVNRMPAIRAHILGGALAVVLIVAAWVSWTIFCNSESNLLTKEWFQEMFSRLQFTEQRLLPSWWLSAGLLEATRQPYRLTGTGDQPWAQSLLFLALLIANALFFHQVCVWLAGKLYRPSYSALYGELARQRRTTNWWVDSLIVERIPWLPRPMRLLLVKDFRLFRRDPVQWSQFLIFFGLLTLYFLNIRRFSYNAAYSTTIGFLNLAVVGLILSTFTTRFIFPMISLEGRQLWILGLLPVHRDLILWSKFVFAAVGSLIPCTGLILLSDLMLQIPWQIVLVHQLSCIVLCIGLSAIAVGLGAKMPDLTERSPSKIAAGFGGTLNLVISAAFIVVVVLLTALPVHLLVASQQETQLAIGDNMLLFLGSASGVAWGAALTFIIGLVATVWPMAVGLRAFRKLEI